MFLEFIEFCVYIIFILDVDDLIVVYVLVFFVEDRRGGVCI